MGTELNPALALQYYYKGAIQDSIQAMFSLGYLLIKCSVKLLDDLAIMRSLNSRDGSRDFLQNGTRGWDRRGAFSNLKNKFSSSNILPPGLVGSHRGPDGSAMRISDSVYTNNNSSNSNLKQIKGMNQMNQIDRIDNTYTMDGEMKNENEKQNEKPIKPPRPSSMPFPQSPSQSQSQLQLQSDSKNHDRFESKSQDKFQNNFQEKSLQGNKNILSISIPSNSKRSIQDPDRDLNRFDNQNPQNNLIAQQMKAEEQVREGVRWLRAAAERGVLDARYQLGLVYEQVCTTVWNCFFESIIILYQSSITLPDYYD